jgi:SPP1 family predicted phage head-tail adaptor
MPSRPYNIGSMDQRVTFKRVTTSAETESVVTVATVWAEVVTIGGSERAIAGQIGTALTYRIRIHRREDITESMRAVWGSRTLEVNAVYDPDGTRAWTMVECTEVV